MGKYIYADNAATTALSRNAYNAMLPYMLEDYGNASQPYSFSRSPKKAIKEARITIADCIGALPEEVFFTSCGTESDNWAIKGAASEGKAIITSATEHHAIIRPCEWLSKRGVPIKFLPVDSGGVVSVCTLQEAIEKEGTLVSIMFANNEIGTVQPIGELADVAHSKGCVFHTDAVQAVGHIPINVKELGIDMLSASAHKFNGPKGIGLLYIRKGLEWSSLLMGGAQEDGHRAGTENVASIVGMAVALQENIKSIAKNSEHILELERCLLRHLEDAGVEFKRNGSAPRIPGNVSLSFRGFSAEAILHRLDLKGIYISTGAACNSKETKISHVLSAIGLDDKLAVGTIRISFGKDNTIDEALYIAKVLSQIVSKKE